MNTSLNQIKLPKVSLEQWVIFQAVVETGSFAKAAEQLYKSQSAISYHINKLQEVIGLQLFEMNGRKADLTEAGQLILKRSQKIINQLRQLEQSINNYQQGVEHELTIMVDELFPIELLSIALKRLEQHYPTTHVTIINHSKALDYQSLQNAKAHCAISKNLINTDSELLMQLDCQAYAHPNYLLHNENSSTVTSHQRQIMHSSSMANQLPNSNLPCCHWQVDSLAMMMELIANKQGYGWLPNIHVEKSTLPLTPLVASQNHKIQQPLYLTAVDPMLIGKAQKYFLKTISELTNAASAEPS